MMFIFPRQATIITLLMAAIALASPAPIPDDLVIARHTKTANGALTWYALSPEAQAQAQAEAQAAVINSTAAAVKRAATMPTSSSQASQPSCGGQWNLPEEVICDPFPKDVPKGYTDVCSHLVESVTLIDSHYYGVPIPEDYRVLCLAEDIEGVVGRKRCCIGWNGSVKKATFDQLTNVGYHVLFHCQNNRGQGADYVSGVTTDTRLGETCTTQCMFGDITRGGFRGGRPCDYAT